MYIAIEPAKSFIITYSILKIGFLTQDQPRLESYGITISDATDASYASSVADYWQGKRIGGRMLQYIINYIHTKGIKKILLWCGAQAGYKAAVAFYVRHGFRQLGQLHYKGDNYDMVLDV